MELSNTVKNSYIDAFIFNKHFELAFKYGDFRLSSTNDLIKYRIID